MPAASPSNRSPAARRALGRGLSALLPPGASSLANGADAQAGRDIGLRLLPIERVVPNREQPRKHFDEAALAELASSIRAQGVLQPIVVRRRGEVFEIVAGERRWRASGLAGLGEVPALVKEYSDAKALQVALIENIQRQDLDPLEEAMAYQRLLAEHAFRHEDLARAVGKTRSAITHSLRLLRLPDDLLALLAGNKLTPGHARALMQLQKNSQRTQLADEIMKRQLSVREAEVRAKELHRGLVRQVAQQGAHKRGQAGQSAAGRDLCERLQRALGTRVRLVSKGSGQKPKRGHLEIAFDSYEALDDITARLLARP